MKVIAHSSLGGSDTFKVKVVAPLVAVTPTLLENETASTFPAAKDTTLSLTITADTNVVQVNKSLQLGSRISVNGVEVTPASLSDAAVADSLGTLWVSLDNIQPVSQHLLVNEVGLATMPTGRQGENSARIAGLVKAFAAEVRDTFLVYPKEATVAIEEVSMALKGVILRSDGPLPDRLHRQ